MVVATRTRGLKSRTASSRHVPDRQYRHDLSGMVDGIEKVITTSWHQKSANASVSMRTIRDARVRHVCQLIPRCIELRCDEKRRGRTVTQPPLVDFLQVCAGRRGQQYDIHGAHRPSVFQRDADTCSAGIPSPRAICKRPSSIAASRRSRSSSSSSSFAPTNLNSTSEPSGRSKESWTTIWPPWTRPRTMGDIPRV